MEACQLRDPFAQCPPSMEAMGTLQSPGSSEEPLQFPWRGLNKKNP